MQQLFGGAIPSAAQGTGIVVSDEGHVLTNYHVVAGADRIRVFAGSEPNSARLVGADALTDLALLVVANLSIPAVRWGDSDNTAAGDFTWAIGNPYGLQRSVTFGIISAVDRDTVASSPFQNFLQTDAALNPGSSGGPLVNVNAEVIGINTAIIGQSFSGISFAIPSNTARDVLAHLRESGKVRRGWIGLRLDDLPVDPARSIDIGHSQGALVGGLSGDVGDMTPARAAGLRPYDVIVRWGDIPVVSAVQLGRQVAQTPIGATVSVRVIRQGVPVAVDVTVGERPNEDQQAMKSPAMQGR